MNKTKKSRLRTYSYQVMSGTAGLAPAIPVAQRRSISTFWGLDTVNGQSLRGYQGLIRQCKDAGTPMNATFGTRTVDSAHYLFRASVTSKCFTGSWMWQIFDSSDPTVPQSFPLLPYPSDEVQRANSALQNKFAQKVRERMQTVSGPTFLGELREALELVRKPGKAIERLWKRFLRRSKNRIKKSPRPKGLNRVSKWHKWFVDRYLEFTYGIAPLLNDVDGAIKALAEFQFLPNVYVYATEQGRPVAMQNATDTPGFSYFITRRTECSVRAAGAIRQDVLMPVGTLQALRRKLGFSWDEFVPTVYELIPFSFVIDYFTNLGDVLNASYTSTAYLAWTSVTARTTQTRDVVISSRAAYAPPSGGGCQYVSKQQTLSRWPGSDRTKVVNLVRDNRFYQVRISWEFPQPKQWFNLAALASSLGEFQKLYSSR